MGYRLKTFSGFSLDSFFKVTSAVVTLAKIVILARLLSKNDFGLFSLTMIAIGLTESITETGINTTIIQSKQSVRYFLNTAWVLAIFRGLIIALIMLLLGMFMSRYYQSPELLFLVGLSAVIPIVKGFINPAMISFYKEMNYLPDTLYRLTLVIVNAALSVGLSWLYPSVYSLVWAILLTAGFEVAMSFVIFKDKPKFEFIKSRAMTILMNARGLNISAIFSYLAENVDNFLVGKLTSIENLGVYQNAYAVSHKPYEIADSVHRATLPAYVRIQADLKRLKRATLRTMIVTLGTFIVATLPLYIWPKFFIELVLGTKWLDMVPLMRILILAAFVQSFTLLTYTVFVSTKKYFYMNLHLIVAVFSLIGLMIYLGQGHNLIGATEAVLISRLVAAPIVIFGLIRTFYL